MKIDILLATYNGEEFLSEQLDSILAQTVTDWHLLIRDDGSTDSTEEILRAYITGHPDQITLIDSDSKNKGACQSFHELLKYSMGDYIFFSDQDDVWVPEKLEVSLQRMRDFEKQDPSKALLIHSDLRVVDKKLNILSNSLWVYQNLDQSIASDVYKLAAHNVITGCSMMINRKAKELSLPIPQSALMHDWWIAINVCKYGQIKTINRPLVLYRQHGSNVEGARRKDFLYYLKKTLHLVNYTVHLWKKGRMLKGLRFGLNPLRVIIAHIGIYKKSIFKADQNV